MALLGSGSIALLLGVRAAVGILRLRRTDRGAALSLARGLRATISGACTAGVGTAIHWQLEWALTVSLTMLAVETLEAAVVAPALGAGAGIALANPQGSNPPLYPREKNSTQI